MSEGKEPAGKQDVRRHARFTVQDEAQVVLYPEQLFNFMGLGKSNRAKAVVNLSEGGVLVRTSKELGRGIPVRILLNIEKFSDRFECKGEVNWCYPAADGGGDYFAGVAFKNLSAADARKIEKLRSWFTSPECKSRTRFRKKSEGLVLPK
jgi:Tfp pilus assembly protein PilZ